MTKETSTKHLNPPCERFLIVGDIHSKPDLVDKITHFLEVNDFNKVIFLGDYEDDWTASPEKTYTTVKKIVDLKLKFPSKIILLSGNHTQCYASAGNFRCSAFNEETRSLIKDFYKTKIDDKYIFQFAFAKGNYLFTHAGVTEKFWKELRSLIKEHHPDLKKSLKSSHDTKASDISTLFNQIFTTGMEDQTYTPFQMFAQAGPARGGLKTPSPLWADKSELIQDPLPYIRQVVGHSPVQTITFYPTRKNEKQSSYLIFCDTISTWYDPYTGWAFDIGDSSLLQMTFGKLGRAKSNTIFKDDWLTS